MLAESTSSTSPLRQIMRSFKRREKMSEVWIPPETVSVTKGMGRAEVGGRVGVALWDAGKVKGCVWRVVMLRAFCWRGLVRRGVVVRRARRVVLVRASMMCCVGDFGRKSDW
jgi:hypothetical protein